MAWRDVLHKYLPFFSFLNDIVVRDEKRGLQRLGGMIVNKKVFDNWCYGLTKVIYFGLMTITIFFIYGKFIASSTFSLTVGMFVVLLIYILLVRFEFD
jgi:hypothetical protein